jgi:hypothetical protein
MGVFDEKAIDILHHVRHRWPSGGELHIGRVDVVYMPGGSLRYQAVFSYGLADRSMLDDHPTWGRFNTLHEAATAAESVLRSYRKRGCQRVGAPGYRGNLTWNECLAKVDTSLTVGFVQPPARRTPPSTGQDHGGRANRNVQI